MCFGKQAVPRIDFDGFSTLATVGTLNSSKSVTLGSATFLLLRVHGYIALLTSSMWSIVGHPYNHILLPNDTHTSSTHPAPVLLQGQLEPTSLLLLVDTALLSLAADKLVMDATFFHQWPFYSGDKCQSV